MRGHRPAVKRSQGFLPEGARGDLKGARGDGAVAFDSGRVTVPEPAMPAGRAGTAWKAARETDATPARSGPCSGTSGRNPAASSLVPGGLLMLAAIRLLSSPTTRRPLRPDEYGRVSWMVKFFAQSG